MEKLKFKVPCEDFLPLELLRCIGTDGHLLHAIKNIFFLDEYDSGHWGG